jgi:hypothetical protein
MVTVRADKFSCAVEFAEALGCVVNRAESLGNGQYELRVSLGLSAANALAHAVLRSEAHFRST